MVELGADGSFESAYAIASEKVFEVGEGGGKFFAKHGEAFAEGGGLCCDIVGPSSEDECLVFGCKLG